MGDLAGIRAARQAETFASTLAKRLGCLGAQDDALAELREIFLRAEQEWQDRIARRAPSPLS